eukprot:scaffold34803_cov48-Phaeocystis_antarctica.AAC.1
MPTSRPCLTPLKFWRQGSAAANAPFTPGMPSQPSQSSDEGPGRGRISRLDLNNFKSYGGKTTLGPFLDFSAVVGPNGAGTLE